MTLRSFTRIACTLAALSTFGCDDSLAPEHAPAQPEDKIPAEAATFHTDGEHLVTVELSSGTTLHFIALDDGGDQAVGIAEVAPASGHRLELVGLDQATPREVFHAITREDVAEPALLAALYPPASMGPRGWYVELIDSELVTVPKADMCSTTTFQNEFAAWQSYIDEIVHISLNSSPNGTPAQWDEVDPFAAGGCGYSGLPCLWRWQRTTDFYTEYNVDRYKTWVAVCNTQTRTNVCHQGACYGDIGPIIAFRYQRGGNSGTGIAFSDDVDSTTAEGASWRWYWNGSASGGEDANWDWKTDINWAWTLDRFHIGAAAEHEGW